MWCINAITKNIYYLRREGRQEDNETLVTTTQREIWEETGYCNTVGDLIGVSIRQLGSAVKLIYWFWSMINSLQQDQNTQDAEENFTSHWLSCLEIVDTMTFSNDIELVGKALQQNHPKTLPTLPLSQVLDWQNKSPHELLELPAFVLVQD